MPLPPEFANLDVPTLGRPFSILGNVPPVAIIQCECEAKTVIVLNGVQAVATCPACRHRYLITKDPRIEVGAMRPELQEVIQ